MTEVRVLVDKEQVNKDYIKGMKYKELAEKYGGRRNISISYKQKDFA